MDSQSNQDNKSIYLSYFFICITLYILSGLLIGYFFNKFGWEDNSNLQTILIYIYYPLELMYQEVDWFHSLWDNLTDK